MSQRIHLFVTGVKDGLGTALGIITFISLTILACVVVIGFGIEVPVLLVDTAIEHWSVNLPAETETGSMFTLYAIAVVAWNLFVSYPLLKGLNEVIPDAK